MRVEEAKGVCKDRTKYKEVISAYLNNQWTWYYVSMGIHNVWNKLLYLNFRIIALISILSVIYVSQPSWTVEYILDSRFIIAHRLWRDMGHSYPCRYRFMGAVSPLYT
jgi:hypothetical protein